MVDGLRSALLLAADGEFAFVVLLSRKSWQCCRLFVAAIVLITMAITPLPELAETVSMLLMKERAAVKVGTSAGGTGNKVAVDAIFYSFYARNCKASNLAEQETKQEPSWLPLIPIHLWLGIS